MKVTDVEAQITLDKYLRATKTYLKALGYDPLMVYKIKADGNHVSIWILDKETGEQWIEQFVVAAPVEGEAE